MEKIQLTDKRVAILVPCYNEELTIAEVVADFRKEIPNAEIYVFDNNSKDRTVEKALAAGATVLREKRQGKGYVMQSMFLKIDADYCVLVDGDGTYPADQVTNLLKPLIDGRADMVIGTRLNTFTEKSFRPLHIFGNKLVAFCINFIFKSDIKDAMSGYRAFSKDFMTSLPIVSKGFEVETELTLQALYRGMVLVEVPILYGERPEGSVSKLRTFHDGFKVLRKVFDIFKAYRPLFFFTMIGAVFGLLGLLIGAVPVTEFIRTGKVTHFSSATLAGLLEVIAIVCVACGLILDSVKHHFQELSILVLKSQSKSPQRNTIHGGIREDRSLTQESTL